MGGHGQTPLVEFIYGMNCRTKFQNISENNPFLTSAHIVGQKELSGLRNPTQRLSPFLQIHFSSIYFHCEIAAQPSSIIMTVGSNRNCTKKLEGIPWTSGIQSIIQSALELPQIPTAPKPVIMEDRATSNSSNTNNNTSPHTSTTARQKALARVPVEQATSMLEKQLQRTKLQTKSDNFCIPIVAIRAIQSLIDQSTADCSTKSTVKQSLEKALQQSISSSSSPLIFASPPSSPDSQTNSAEHKKFQARLKRLRMRAEEQKYIRLTSNIAIAKQDDVTTKSMTYAASVGLNMIVAPLSFGAFMYFFSGQLLGWVVGLDSVDPDQVDIRKVIAGVVSGVCMMFIEMILFVIRSHELDASTTKKAKKKGLTPFGDYVKSKSS